MQIKYVANGIVIYLQTTCCTKVCILAWLCQPHIYFEGIVHLEAVRLTTRLLRNPWVSSIDQKLLKTIFPAANMMASFLKSLNLRSSSVPDFRDSISGLRYVSGIRSHPGNRTWQIPRPEFSPRPKSAAEAVPLWTLGSNLNRNSSAFALEKKIRD